MKTVLVTGSSRGLGKAMALEFGKKGYYVGVHYVNSATPAQEVVQEILDGGGKAALFQANIATSEACTGLIKKVQNELGSLEVLINNAGITKDGLAMRMKNEDWQGVIDTNLSSAFYLSKTALRGMVSKKWGRIINITSVVGLIGNIGQANYVSAKAGLIGLTKALAREYASKGITVNAVAPGFIESDMTANLPANLKDSYLESIPTRRFGQPEEIAKVTAFLASEDAAYVNGQIIAVDGGMSMR